LVEEHLQRCPSCAQEAATLSRINAALAVLPDEMTSPAFIRNTVRKAAAIRKRLYWKKHVVAPVFSFIRNAVSLVFLPGGYGYDDENNLSSSGYLRTFDDSPPGSFADVYLTVIQGGGN
jgi:anti-sigma factor RsiW